MSKLYFKFGAMASSKTANALIHIGSPIAFDTDMFLSQLPMLMKVAYDGDEAQTRDLVAKLVHTYHPAGEHGSEYKGTAYEQQMEAIKQKEQESAAIS